MFALKNPSLHRLCEDVWPCVPRFKKLWQWIFNHCSGPILCRLIFTTSVIYVFFYGLNRSQKIRIFDLFQLVAERGPSLTDWLNRTKSASLGRPRGPWVRQTCVTVWLFDCFYVWLCDCHSPPHLASWILHSLHAVAATSSRDKPS